MPNEMSDDSECLFRCTEAELRRAFPTWRVPDAVARVYEGINPFTRQPSSLRTWDPDPSAAADDPPAAPPGERHPLGCGLDWLGAFAALDAVVRGSPLPPDDELEIVRQALYGPEHEGPRDVVVTIHVLPASVADALAVADDAERDRLLDGLAAMNDLTALMADRLGRRRLRDELAAIGKFIDVARQAGEGIYLWVAF